MEYQMPTGKNQLQRQLQQNRARHFTSANMVAVCADIALLHSRLSYLDIPALMQAAFSIQCQFS